MNMKVKVLFRLSVACIVTCSLAEATIAQPIETGLFTQNHLRLCTSETSCQGPSGTLQFVSDYDLSVDGLVTTHVAFPELDAQAATNASYGGNALAPSLTLYAYTSGGQRYSVGNFGFQKYTFLETGLVTLTGTITYEQSGGTGSTAIPSGLIRASFVSFQFDDDEFNASRCNIFVDYSADNIAGTLNTCVYRNGEIVGGSQVIFDGLENVQIADFSIPNTAVANGSDQATLQVSGNAGDVFFLGASLGVGAHLGGWADTGNTLKIEADNPSIVQPAFDQLTEEPAPPRLVDIDLKPGSEANCINISGAGVIPVGIFGSNVLDVLDVDPETLSFGGLEVRIRGKRGPMCHLDYLDADANLDMVCQFEDDPSRWSPEEGVASLTGAKLDGSLFEGVDSICIVPDRQ